MASSADQPGGGAAARTGAELRNARQRLGWDLADVAAGLRIRLGYLQALEDGRLADLPGNAYAVGFLRTYSAALGLDPEEMTRRFRAEAAEVNRKTELTFPAPVPERGVPAGAVILLGVLLAIGGYVGWYRMSDGFSHHADAIPDVPPDLASLAGKATGGAQSPQVASLQPSPDQRATISPEKAPQAAAVPAGTPAIPPILAPQRPSGQVASLAESPSAAEPDAADAAGSQRVALPPPPATSALSAAAATPPPVQVPQGPRVVLRATADAWVQVRQKQGPVLLNRILRAGETWPVPDDKTDLLLTTGNAGGTELTVDGVTTPPLGNSGAVRRDLPLDPDLIKSGALAPKGSVQPASAGPSQPASTQRLQAQ